MATAEELRALCEEQERELKSERSARGASGLLAILSAWRSTALWRAWSRWAETSLAWELEALTIRMARREADLRRVKQDAATARESSSELLARLEAELEQRNAKLLEMRASSSNAREARLDNVEALSEAKAMLDERAREAAEARMCRLGSLLAGISAARQGLALSRWRVAAARLPSTDGRARDRRFGSQTGTPEIAPLDRVALEASHAQLSTRARLLQRRLDGLVTEKERLQAQANERDRELRHEAAALRAALLAAGGAARGHIRGSPSPGGDMVGAAEAAEAEATLERAALRRRVRRGRARGCGWVDGSAELRLKSCPPSPPLGLNAAGLPVRLGNRGILIPSEGRDPHLHKRPSLFGLSRPRRGPDAHLRTLPPCACAARPPVRRHPRLLTPRAPAHGRVGGRLECRQRLAHPELHAAQEPAG